MMNQSVESVARFGCAGRTPSCCCTLAVMAAMALSASAGHVVWQIGTKDGTGNEFALAPTGYADFLQNDFGWEDKFFLVGHSSEKKDFPYVLPGVNDKWAGSGSPALKGGTLELWMGAEPNRQWGL